MPILQVRDKDGNFVSIPAIEGARGERGKSAYEQAKEGGYEGTEEEFIALLNGLESAASVEYVDEQTANVKTYVDEKTNEVSNRVTPIALGGTGADNAEDALRNLGAASPAYVDEQIANIPDSSGSCDLLYRYDTVGYNESLQFTKAPQTYKELIVISKASDNANYMTTTLPMRLYSNRNLATHTFALATAGSLVLTADISGCKDYVSIEQTSTTGQIWGVYGIA